MVEHIELSDIPEFCIEIEKWLKARYGEEEGNKLWELINRQYDKYLEDLPDYSGRKTSHALAIYGSIVIFSMYPLLPDHPPVEELQELVTKLFMPGFVKLGKLFNLNRSYTPSTILASIFSFLLISRATFNVGSHFPDM